jgi:hypothetical protein
MRKRTKTKSSDHLASQYDFSRGERGKHADEYRRHTVRINKTDGTTVVQNFKLAEGAVVLAPDVLEYFSDSASVNKALRTLIDLIPKKERRPSAR